ncbi:hypothetical protein [Streptoalloteichus hindustanus]|uniref:DUF308 domain-containing protein n=1 Tax=Streptoalloteichus hindustanus TaxID=2017 RepID=A0A1M5BDB5_STRHI|nr:hypothetical protein [Streptoalloteichus hindustanus]SHF40499.1 hypothetical protein SAMN05444320_103518 [Streptoalloteichus hindustanus]
MTGRTPSQDGPEDVDAAFAEIVADLEREGGLRWPDEAELDQRPDRPVRPDAASPDAAGAVDRPGGGVGTAPEPPAPSTVSGQGMARGASPEAGSPPADSPDDHYVPPEPPPLPPLRAPTVGALALLVVGVLLLVVPSLVGLSHQLAMPLALIALTSGIAWLVLRMRQGPPPDSGWDDGAQV